MVPRSRSRITAAPDRTMASMVILLTMPITLMNQPGVAFGLNDR